MRVDAQPLAQGADPLRQPPSGDSRPKWVSSLRRQPASASAVGLARTLGIRMQRTLRTPQIPRHIQVLFVVFFTTNLVHFAHNAEYISFYPGIPPWLTREKVYIAWVAGATVGLLGLFVSRTRLKALGMTLIAAYGALGIDGLVHYTLALCSEHTLATNLTIWFEVLAGMSLLLASATRAGRALSGTAAAAS